MELPSESFYILQIVGRFPSIIQGVVSFLFDFVVKPLAKELGVEDFSDLSFRGVVDFNRWRKRLNVVGESILMVWLKEYDMEYIVYLHRGRIPRARDDVYRGG